MNRFHLNYIRTLISVVSLRESSCDGAFVSKQDFEESC